MKKVLLFLVLLAGVGGTGYLCMQANETLTAQNNIDSQQESAVTVRLASADETTTETTEAATETTTEDPAAAARATLPDYKDAIGTYVVTVPSALADTAGGEVAGTELAANLVVGVNAEQDVDGVSWAQVTYYGMTGWMPKEDLAYLADGQRMQESTGTYLFVEPGNTVTVYAESTTPEERAALTAGESSEAAEAGTLSYGSELTAEEASGEWIRVSSGDVTGWIPAVSAASYYPGTYYYANTNVNLRAEPGTDGEKVGDLKKGTTVLISEFQNGWAKVESDGQTGWAALYYMTPCENSDGGAAVQAAAATPTAAPAAQAASSGSSSGSTSSSTGGSSSSTGGTSSGNTQPSTNNTGGTTETPSGGNTDDTLNWESDPTEDSLSWE